MRSFLAPPLAAMALLAATPPALAQNPAPFTIAETGRHFARLQEAVNAIGGHTGTIRIAAGNWHECAVQQAGSIAYVAEQPGQVVLSGTICEGKAALVLRGTAARVDGLTFANLRVAEGNGAGIRLEKGNLAVSQSWFRDSEEGILTADDPHASITIDKSTFTHLGRCDRGLSCAHALYTGDYGSLAVTRSRFEAGSGGHYLKSRAARVTIEDNSFDDTAGHTTNYMIDLCAGATGRIAGNWFVQGRDKENWSTFIAIAAESRSHPSAGLVVEGNVARFAPGLSRANAFVADWSGAPLVIRQNQLGAGISPFQRR